MRFYGGHPLSWWRMPGAMRDALLRRIPKLQAEETMMLANAVAIGVGAQGDKDRARALKDTVRGLRRAMGHDVGGSAKATSWDEHFANLAAKGFTVRVDGQQMVAVGGDE